MSGVASARTQEQDRCERGSAERSPRTSRGSAEMNCARSGTEIQHALWSGSLFLESSPPCSMGLGTCHASSDGIFLTWGQTHSPSANATPARAHCAQSPCIDRFRLGQCGDVRCCTACPNRPLTAVDFTMRMAGASATDGAAVEATRRRWTRLAICRVHVIHPEPCSSVSSSILLLLDFLSSTASPRCATVVQPTAYRRTVVWNTQIGISLILAIHPPLYHHCFFPRQTSFKDLALFLNPTSFILHASLLRN